MICEFNFEDTFNIRCLYILYNINIIINIQIYIFVYF